MLNPGEVEHTPVMLAEAIKYLAIKDDGCYLDCTLGAGGHAREILRRLGPAGRLIGLDRDREARLRASERLAGFGDRLMIVGSDYRHLDQVLAGLGITRIDGILFDLGISSFQVLDPRRGFSYSYDAPLDMRMDTTSPFTAADLVNSLPEEELSEIIFRYGEERWAGRIAAFIVEARKKGRIERTGQLVELIKAAIPAGARRQGPHPAKRTFQALRIEVNDELNGVEEGIRAGVRYLVPEGRMVVISFHSLEDRIVKNLFKELATGREDPVTGRRDKAPLRILTKKPLTPTAEEIKNNPRSRSAKLRAVVRTEVITDFGGE